MRRRARRGREQPLLLHEVLGIRVQGICRSPRRATLRVYETRIDARDALFAIELLRGAVFIYLGLSRVEKGS